MMLVKRITYAARAAVDEVAKLSRDIKQVIQPLQKKNRKKDQLVDEYAKLIQGLKRERVRISYRRKKTIDRFLKKTRGRET